jgi:hypothetical protein
MDKQKKFVKTFSTIFVLYGLLTQVIMQFKWYLGYLMLVPLLFLYKWFSIEVDKITLYSSKKSDASHVQEVKK